MSQVWRLVCYYSSSLQLLPAQLNCLSRDLKAGGHQIGLRDGSILQSKRTFGKYSKTSLYVPTYERGGGK